MNEDEKRIRKEMYSTETLMISDDPELYEDMVNDLLNAFVSKTYMYCIYNASKNRALETSIEEMVKGLEDFNTLMGSYATLLMLHTGEIISRTTEGLASGKLIEANENYKKALEANK